MTSADQKVYVFGRLRGVTARRLRLLARAARLALTRRPPAADIIVLAHGTARSAVSERGELRLRIQAKRSAQFLSERSFRSRIGILPPKAVADSRYSEDQVAKLAGLNAEQLRTLALYDVVSPTESGLSYTDLIVARAVGRLSGEGAVFPKIIAAALALEERGMSLSGVRLAEAPWGELVQVIDGRVAQVDGQLVLSLEGSDVNSDEAFAGAESYEQAGELEQAERLYDLAARLDKVDPVIPFNLGNVLDELGREREAEFAYRQALARDPEFSDAWFNLGVLQEKIGRDDEALSSYEKAFTAEPAYADALHNAALLLMRKRRFSAALKLLDQLVAIPESSGGEARRLAHLCRLELKQEQERRQSP
jgi:tetratricopeptide (TPR) repeat protein